MVDGSELTLVIGAASSGKSMLAERLATIGGRVVYIATARPIDIEMKDKIEAHRRRRPADWRTLEAVSPELDKMIHNTKAAIVVIDGLTLYAAATMSVADDPEAHMIDVIAALRRRRGSAIVVSDEVGAGIVPESPVGRAFRRLLGTVNQRLAAEADNVYLVAAGLPLRLKGREISGESGWA